MPDGFDRSDIHEARLIQSSAQKWLNGDDGKETHEPDTRLQFSGDCFERLLLVAEKFQEKYPDYKTKKIKKNDDLRPWIKEIFNCTDREAIVFSTIVTETFNNK